MKKLFYLLSVLAIGIVFISANVSMTSIDKLTLKIEELLDQGNVNKGLESMNVTTAKIVSVASVKYEDLKGTRIKNISDSIQTFRVIFRDASDTILWKFTPGWNPEVIRTIVKSTSNSTTTIYTGK